MNCVIYPKGSDEIRYFVRDCVKTGNNFVGSNKSISGIKPTVFDFLWTEDDITRIGEGWDKKVSDITPASGGIEIAKSSHSELVNALGRRAQIANMTFEQVDEYIDSHVTDLASARAFLKVLAKVVLAVIKIQDKE